MPVGLNFEVNKISSALFSLVGGRLRVALKLLLLERLEADMDLFRFETLRLEPFLASYTTTPLISLGSLVELLAPSM